MSGQGASTLPTPDDVARRGQLRGLGEELMRMDAENQRSRQTATDLEDDQPFFSCWFRGRLTSTGPFLQTAASALHSTLNPFNDTAVLEAHGEEFLELLVNKASDKEWTYWLFKSLMVTARADNIDVFRRLFALCKNNPEFWVGKNSCRTSGILCYTATYGSAEVLSALLEVDFFLSALRSDEMTRKWCPLRNAVQNGHRSCVAVLIKVGVPLDYKWKMAGTVLTMAVEHGHEGIVLELLAAGLANVNDQGTKRRPAFRNNPLCIAACGNDESMVDILLAAGADFGKNRTDTLPIMLAAWGGHCRPLQRLLVAGADPNAVNARGQSALHLACEASCEGAVEILLRHNAGFTSRCDEGLLPYDAVAMWALSWRERPYGGPQRHPSTLNVVETAAADCIYGMLQRASAWRRRGWLVMMRARRLVAAQLLHESSLEKPSPAAHVGHGHNEETTERKPNCVFVAVEGLSLANTPPTGTLGEFSDRDNNAVSTKALLSGGGHDNGKQAGHGGGWECAVEWLLQCPDECGVFRETLGFL